VTGFEHDADGNLTKIVDPDLSEREFAYDQTHRLTGQTSKRGFATAYDYDFAGRFAQSNLPDGATRRLTAAQTVGLVDTSGGEGGAGAPAPVVRPDDVMASFTDGNGNARETTLNEFGSPTGLQDALGRTMTIERDADSLATRVTAPSHWDNEGGKPRAPRRQRADSGWLRGRLGKSCKIKIFV